MSKNIYMQKEDKFSSYERSTDMILRPDELIILRFDGVDFTKHFLRKFTIVEYEFFTNVIESSLLELCVKHQNIKIAYFGVDEISLILNGRAIIENYDNRLQKLLSIFSSEITMLFHKFKSLIPKEIIATYKDFFAKAVYSGKAYNLPTDKMNEYLKWRQEAAKAFTSDKLKLDDVKKIMDKGFIFQELGKYKIYEIDLTSNEKKVAFKPQGDIQILVNSPISKRNK